MLGKSKWSAAWFHYISIALKLAYNRNKLFKTLHYWSRDMLNFDILDKGLGIVSAAHLVYDFSTKMFLKLYSINWPNFIVWLPVLLEILGNMCNVIKAWLSVKILFPVQCNTWKNIGNDQKPMCSPCIAIELHNFKILLFLLYGYCHTL